MTEDGTNPLPLEEEHCTAVEVTEEEVQNSVTLITSLSTVVSYSSPPPGPENYAQDMIRWVFLVHPDCVPSTLQILVKSMLRKRSFSNPFECQGRRAERSMSAPGGLLM